MEQFTGTRPVAASHAFDTTTLEAYLRVLAAGFEGLRRGA